MSTAIAPTVNDKDNIRTMIRIVFAARQVFVISLRSKSEQRGPKCALVQDVPHRLDFPVTAWVTYVTPSLKSGLSTHRA